MLRQSFAVLAASAAMGLAGCASSNAPTGATAAVPEETASPQLVAYSAKAEYPQTQPTSNFPLAAIVNKGLGTLTVYNFSDKPIGDAKVWVNHAFVYHIVGIAPQSKVLINEKDLFDSFGNSFGGQRYDVNNVQLQTGQELHNILGPANY